MVFFPNQESIKRQSHKWQIKKKSHNYWKMMGHCNCFMFIWFIELVVCWWDLGFWFDKLMGYFDILWYWDLLFRSKLIMDHCLVFPFSFLFKFGKLLTEKLRYITMLLMGYFDTLFVHIFFFCLVLWWLYIYGIRSYYS